MGVFKLSYLAVKERILKACERSGRSPDSVFLLAVSKFQSEEKIRALVQQGQFHFGENYVQELTSKIDKLREENLKWHFIGHLQKNKAKMLSGRCELIHSVDSLALAQVLQKRALESGVTEKVLLQVNLSNENSKEGFTADSLLQNWSEISSLPQLKIQGLMTMPPLQNEPEENRVFFRKLRELRDLLQGKTDPSKNPMTDLSMGTSHDFEIAIEEGATWVRVGTLVFGERSLPPKS